MNFENKTLKKHCSIAEKKCIYYKKNKEQIYISSQLKQLFHSSTLPGIRLFKSSSCLCASKAHVDDAISRHT